MSRLVQKILFGLAFPCLIVSFAFALAGSLADNLPLFSDAFAEGADIAEILTVAAEETAATLPRLMLFVAAVALPALLVAGPLALAFTRRRHGLVLAGLVAGAVWAAWFDYADSFFTGPGVEWDWPAGGALYGAAVAALAARFLARRGLL